VNAAGYIQKLKDTKVRLLKELTEAQQRIEQLEEQLRCVATLHAYLYRAENQALRWQDPLPVPEWVGDVRAILEGEER
jgi:chromosome segregation ATPase